MSEQEKPRLKIEEEIIAQLGGDLQKNALDFIAYLKESGMTPDATHSSAFRYFDKWVCILIIMPIDGKIGWTIFDNPLCGREYDLPVDDDLKEFAWKHVNICCHFTSGGKYCGCGNQPGKHATIFGKEFDNVCTSEVAFSNPDAGALKKIVRLIDAWKDHVVEEIQRKP